MKQASALKLIMMLPLLFFTSCLSVDYRMTGEGEGETVYIEVPGETEYVEVPEYILVEVPGETEYGEVMLLYWLFLSQTNRSRVMITFLILTTSSRGTAPSEAALHS